jgi:hypothetical protein
MFGLWPANDNTLSISQLISQSSSNLKEEGKKKGMGQEDLNCKGKKGD